jgi:hypothetical protein
MKLLIVMLVYNRHHICIHHQVRVYERICVSPRAIGDSLDRLYGEEDTCHMRMRMRIHVCVSPRAIGDSLDRSYGEEDTCHMRMRMRIHVCVSLEQLGIVLIGGSIMCM